jgi:hypothetical protein
MEPLFPELSCKISGCDGTMTKVSDTEAVCTCDDKHRRKLTLEPKKQSVGAAPKTVPTGNPEHLR